MSREREKKTFTCGRCRQETYDYRQRGKERICICCVDGERAALEARIAEVEGERDENRRWADHWNHRMSVHLRRVGEMEKAATYAAAELRHAYRDRPIDPNLVARAIETLEALALPGAEGKGGCADE